jgi:hypothetical protein
MEIYDAYTGSLIAIIGSLIKSASRYAMVRDAGPHFNLFAISGFPHSQIEKIIVNTYRTKGKSIWKYT